MQPTRATFLLSVCLTGSLLLAGCKKQGEGDTVTRPLTLAPLEGVDLGVVGTVYLTQGSPQKIEVRGQENILNLLKTDVDNGVWRIKFSGNGARDYDRLAVYVTVPTLKRVELSGSGDIRGTTSFTTANLSVAIPGSGDITLSGTAPTQDVRISGSGSYHGFDVGSTDVTTDISGSGSIEVRAAATLRADISGSGNVRYKGNPVINSNIGGSGRLINSN